MLAALLLVGCAIPFVPPSLLLAAAVALVVMTAVVVHPPIAAYALIGITPLWWQASIGAERCRCGAPRRAWRSSWREG